jgi:hypothetical protein
MTQGVLPFKYEEEKKLFGSTALGGTVLFLDLLYKMDFANLVITNLRAKEEKQGWNDFQFLICLILLNINGGDCVDDVKAMEGDDGLRLILKHLEIRNSFGRRRQKLKRKWRWRNGLQNSLPSASSIFRYLALFHNEEQEALRESSRKAFIPESNKHLSGLARINKCMLEFLQCNNFEKTATIDMDATIIESNKKEALYSYKKKIKGYQPLNAWWSEQNYLVHTEFRDGNVPAGFDQKRVFIETLSMLPQGVEKVYLRSDTAGYQHNLLKYCEFGENPRFGRIGFAIGCDVVDEFKKSVCRESEEDWHPIFKEVIENGEVKLKETGQEWAEVCYVPNEISRSKKGPDYRYLAIREPIRQKVLPGEDMEELSQQTFTFPNIKLNNTNYKLYGLVTNLDWGGEAIIHWMRERCGDSEHVHHEMKQSFAGGQLPSAKFGENAAWWWIMVLSLNLVSIMKSLVLSKKWKKSRMKRLRYSIIKIAGRVISGSNEMIIRLSQGNPVYELYLNARKRIALLLSVSVGCPLGAVGPGG